MPARDTWTFSDTATITIQSLGLDAQGSTQTCADAVRLLYLSP